MSWLKRIGLFILVNLLVVLSISIILSLLRVQPYLTQQGLDIKNLMIFCLVWGMAGSFISLLLSRQMAKWVMGVKVIGPEVTQSELREIVRMVESLATRSHLPMPQVGIFESNDVNAFATGPSKSRSLVAISTGALRQLTKDELEGVLAHEMTHIANGDMVTMTLLQGVVNAFVMFFARLLAFVITQASRGNNKERSVSGSYYLFVWLFEIVFMLLGSMVVCAFSRWREFRADAGGAHLAGRSKMVHALQHLQLLNHAKLTGAKGSLSAFMIASPDHEPSLLMRLFSTHPPLKERIARLQKT